MSWKAYEVLTFEPDLRTEPIMGIGEPGREDLLVGMKPGYSEWVGDTSLAFKFAYRISTPEISTSFREFMDRHKGRWARFFLPSWHSDFTLEASAAVGANQLTVSEFGFAELTENRPDTEKRIIFALTTDGILQTFQVLSAGDSGGNEIITLDGTLTTALDPETTMMGVCYLVRLASDSQQYRYDAPGQASIELRFVSDRVTRRVDTQESVTSSAQGNLLAGEDLLATDQDPDQFIHNEPDTLGPNNYNSAQALNFINAWSAQFVAGPLFRMTSSTETRDSTLYDEGAEVPHIQFCFDAVSTEVLAWETPSSADTIRLRWFESGVPQELEFTGRTPVLFNTWAIDSTVTAGTAETVVYYTKPGYSAIFMRRINDSFATETQWLQTPTAPLYLYRAEKVGARIEIVGMDATHRHVRWRSEAYQTLNLDLLGAAVTLEDGEYRSVNEPTDPEGDAMGAAVALDTGDYFQVSQPTDPEGDAMGAAVALDTGLYEFNIKPTDPEGDALGAAVTLEDGVYFEAAQPTENAGDAAGAAVTLTTGTYEQP